MLARSLRKSEESQCDSKTDADIMVVCDAILEHSVGSSRQGAPPCVTVDLFVRGLEILGSGVGIAKYKKQMGKDFNLRGARQYKFESRQRQRQRQRQRRERRKRITIATD
jgi:hypothetical protein